MGLQVLHESGFPSPSIHFSIAKFASSFVWAESIFGKTLNKSASQLCSPRAMEGWRYFKNPQSIPRFVRFSIFTLVRVTVVIPDPFAKDESCIACKMLID